MTKSDRDVLEQPGRLMFSSKLSIAPGDLAEMEVYPFLGLGGKKVSRSFVPREIELAPGPHDKFDVLDVVVEAADDRASSRVVRTSILYPDSAQSPGRYRLGGYRVRSGQQLRIKVRNRSAESCSCSGVVNGSTAYQDEVGAGDRTESGTVESSPCAPAENADPPGFLNDLFDKCRGWFIEGLSAAVADHQREQASGSGPRPGSTGIWLGNEVFDAGFGIRRALRELVMQAVAAAQIPFAAARLYWEELIDVKNRERRGIRQTIIPVGPARVEAGAEVSVSADVLCTVRPTELHMYSTVADNFELVDVKVGKNYQMATTKPISCWAFGPDMPGSFVMEEAGPGRPITLRARNTSTVEQNFEAFLVGELS